MRAQVYKDPRPKEHFDRFHERARQRGPDLMYELVRVVTSLMSWIVFRARTIDADNVPPSGAVILAPNHFSFMDHFFLGVSIRRKVRFMAKSQLFKPPMEWIYSPGGVFPVRRGFADEEAFITARSILDRGGVIAMYSEGGRSRTGKLSETVRPGIGRLALQSGATVVPVAIHGSSRVRNWKRLQFPKVTILYGDPIRWEPIEEPTREQQQKVANAIFAEFSALYDLLESVGRKCAYLRGAVAALELRNARVVCERAEDWGRRERDGGRAAYAAAAARALAPLAANGCENGIRLAPAAAARRRRHAYAPSARSAS
jgi:1-acyl-sn-glycerol-3-phosphate acyltransferase